MWLHTLDAVAQEELLAAGETLDRRHQPQEEAVVGFQCRTRAARAVLDGASGQRCTVFGRRAVAHGPCAPLSQRPVRRFLHARREAAGTFASGPVHATGAANGTEKSTRGLRPLDPRGKEVKIQGVSVRATRNPLSSSRWPVSFQPRKAERRYPGM